MEWSRSESQQSQMTSIMSGLKQTDTHDPILPHTHTRRHTYTRGQSSEAYTYAHMQNLWLSLIVMFQLAAEDCSSHTQSGHASHLGLLQSKRQPDGRTDRLTDRLMVLHADSYWKMKRAGWNQNTVMSIIRRGSELCLPWNYNMVMDSILVFSISLSVGITPPALQLYKSHSSLWKQTFTLSLLRFAWTRFCLQLPGYK